MLKTLLIIGLVLAFLVGGLLTLRSANRTGQPSDEVVRRAKEREKQLESAESKQHED
jgi:uncharacterized membrane protein YciS (DUF1049 family)